MLDGLNIAAAGMAAQQKRIAAVANDLANTSTTGYKHTRVGFRDLLYTPTARASDGTLRAGTGVAVTDGGRAWAQGALQRTDRPLDLGIEGEGFLRVRLPDGRDALTRDGSLHVDASGRLVTASGAVVQPPVRVPAGTAESDIAVGPDGTVRAGERAIGRLDLVTVRSPQGLAAAGDNAFVVTDASGGAVRAPAATRLVQGVLERSNVDVGDAMVDMIDAQRSFQFASRAIQTADEMMQIANGIRR